MKRALNHWMDRPKTEDHPKPPSRGSCLLVILILIGFAILRLAAFLRSDAGRELFDGRTFLTQDQIDFRASAYTALHNGTWNSEPGDADEEGLVDVFPVGNNWGVYCWDNPREFADWCGRLISAGEAQQLLNGLAASGWEMFTSQSPASSHTAPIIEGE